MNRDIFDGKWKQVRGAIQQRWGDLTDDDLSQLQGRYDQFVGLLQNKYGHTREKAEKEIEARLAHISEWQEVAEATKNQVTTAVKEKPWAVVLPVLLVAALLGLWLKSAKS